MLYQGLSEDIKRAKPFYRDRSYSSALFHLVRALDRSKKLIEQYPTSIEAAEAKPFMDTIRDVIEKMDVACAETDRVRHGCVYVERLRKPEAEEDCSFLKRMMAKQSTIDDSLDRGHWGLTIQECKVMEKSVSDFTLANPDSLVFYPLMVLLDELSDREVEAEGNRQAYEDAYAELNKQKQALLRGKLSDRVAHLKQHSREHLAPIRVGMSAQSRITDYALRITPSSPQEMAHKRPLIRAQLTKRLSRSTDASPPAVRLGVAITADHADTADTQALNLRPSAKSAVQDLAFTRHSALRPPRSSILNLQSSIRSPQSPPPAPFPTSTPPAQSEAKNIQLAAAKTADHADTADQIPLNLGRPATSDLGVNAPLAIGNRQSPIPWPLSRST